VRARSKRGYGKMTKVKMGSLNQIKKKKGTDLRGIAERGVEGKKTKLQMSSRKIPAVG